MSKIFAVVGGQFGDEGKGLMVDYLSHQLQCGIVVRHNGGSQAGHSIQLLDGTRHIFSHFGSGTFNNFPTLLASKFVVNPLLFRKEHKELLDKGYTPKVYVHSDCYITTPYDMIINQILETNRGDSRHGSCGIGFGETIERNENYPLLSSIVSDLRTDTIKQTIDLIRGSYFQIRIIEHYPDILADKQDELLDQYSYMSSELLEDFLQSCEYFLNNVTIISDYDILKDSNIIFEGAQGLLLDQNYGKFPYVTRSNTGLDNVVDILNDIDNTELLTVVHVSRSYTTRHGAGPLDYEEEFPEVLKLADKTNVHNTFQGSLRYAPLNLDNLIDACRQDLTNAESMALFPMDSKLAITWLDIIPLPYKIIFDGKEYEFLEHDKVIQIFEDTVAYRSFGPTRETIKERNISTTVDLKMN